MKRLSILLCVVLVFGLGSCKPIKQDDVSVISVESVTPNGGSKIGVTLLVENKYRKDIRIDHAKVSISNYGKPFLDAMVVDGIVIPAKGVNSVFFNIAYKITDPFAVLGIALEANNNPNWRDSITLKGEVKVKVGVVGKTITIPEISLNDAMKMLESQGIDTKGVNFLKF